MADVLFKRGLATNLPSEETANADTIYIATDTGAMQLGGRKIGLPMKEDGIYDIYDIKNDMLITSTSEYHPGHTYLSGETISFGSPSVNDTAGLYIGKFKGMWGQGVPHEEMYHWYGAIGVEGIGELVGFGTDSEGNGTINIEATEFNVKAKSKFTKPIDVSQIINKADGQSQATIGLKATYTSESDVSAPWILMSVHGGGKALTIYSGDTTDKELVKIAPTTQGSTEYNMTLDSTIKLTGIVTPTNDADAVNKSYVDSKSVLQWETF